MEVEFRAGAKIDAASPDEVRQIVHNNNKDILDKLARGAARYPSFRHDFNLNAAGATPADGTTTRDLGPRGSYVWLIQWMTFVADSGAYGTVAIYRNSATPGNLIVPPQNLPYSTILSGNFAGDGLVLNPANQLVLVVAGGTANDKIHVNGDAKELPLDANYLLEGS